MPSANGVNSTPVKVYGIFLGDIKQRPYSRHVKHDINKAKNGIRFFSFAILKNTPFILSLSFLSNFVIMHKDWRDKIWITSRRASAHSRFSLI